MYSICFTCGRNVGGDMDCVYVLNTYYFRLKVAGIAYAAALHRRGAGPQGCCLRRFYQVRLYLYLCTNHYGCGIIYMLRKYLIEGSL